MSRSAKGPAVDRSLLAHSAEELYEYGPCGYLSMLPDGAIVQANHTFLRWTGYQREELVGRRLQELLTVPGKIFYDTHYAPLLKMQGFVNELAFELVRADGSQLPILLNSSLKRSEAGEPQLIMTAIFDATDRRGYERELLKARREAERASRIKAELLSMISHDVRTPVGSIMMAAELLEKAGVSPAQEKPLRILRSAAGNLLTLVNEVLDFSRMEADRVSLNAAPFELVQALEDLLLSLRPIAERKGVELLGDLDPELPQAVVGDRGKLVQVLGNLLTNALKFTEQGEVRLQVQPRAQNPHSVVLHFAVSDTGIGIPEDRLPYIFEEFTQASAETRERFGGTGLGLAISRRLLALYGSEMRVTSREGEGSTFSFSLSLPKAMPGDERQESETGH